MSGHHDDYWLYGGNAGYWPAAKRDVKASEKTSYQCLNHRGFFNKYGVWPQQLGLSHFQIMDGVKWYAFDKNFAIDKDKVDRIWQKWREHAPPLTFGPSSLQAEWEAAEQRAGAPPLTFE